MAGTAKDTRNKRSALQREKDREVIASRVLRGDPQNVVARDLGISPSQVTYDMKKIRAEWRQRAQTAMDEMMGEQLAKIDEIERQAWQAWFRSMQEMSTKTQYAKADEQTGQPKPSSAVIRTDPGMGDPRHLMIVQWCVEQRLRIFGLYAKDKQQFNINVNGGATINFATMEDAEINDEIERLTRIAMAQTDILTTTGVIVDVTPVVPQLPAGEG
jgi:DNA-binding CsgD family transcriptional regulator